MQDHQKRVVDEHNGLVEKRNRLETFIDSGTFDKVHKAEQCRLILQSGIMKMYIMILADRIANF